MTYVAIIRSYKFISSFAFVFVSAICKNFVSLLRGYDERFITAGKDSSVNLDIPIFKRNAYGLYLTFYALFYRR